LKETPMQIEHAHPSDLTNIMTMIHALSAFHGDTATITHDQAHAAFFGPKASATALVARDGDEMIGYAGLHHTVTLHTGVPRIDIHHLFIADTHRNQGIGRALIAYAADLAKQQGAAGLTIGTAPENLSAQTAYRAMGFTEITDAGPRFRIPSE
jgi:GNAT superfamily N-acetyltransferase